MARIADAEIERLKMEVSVERLAEARGIKLRRHGANLLGLCPFHDDREPSLVITPEKNLWHCMGACQTGGSAIDWVMRAEGVSFRLAVELLRKDVTAVSSLGGEGAKKPPKQTSTVKLPPLVSLDASDEALLVRVANYYHATLKESPEAMAYLQARGIGSAEAVERFRIGYANRTLGYRLPQKNRVAGEDIRGRLSKLGVLRESGHEHMSGSVVIPILDVTGTKVLGMYGRKITPNLRAGTALHLYLPGPHRGVWNEAALSAEATGGEVILCEALIDALTFWCAGYRNVTAAYGVEGLTEAHWGMLERTKTRVVRIAYDRDEAGDRAAEALSKKLNAKGIETYRVLFPKGMERTSTRRRWGRRRRAWGSCFGTRSGWARERARSPSMLQPPQARSSRRESRWMVTKERRRVRTNLLSPPSRSRRRRRWWRPTVRRTRRRARPRRRRRRRHRT